jgi:hypothetical protein
LRIDHRDLPAVGLRIVLDQSRQRVGRAHAITHQRQPFLAVAWIDERLGRDRADAGLGPGNDRADREPVRLDGDAHVAGA